MEKFNCLFFRRSVAIVMALFFSVLLKQNSGFSYEREIILSDEYQTEKEKQRYEDLTKPQEEKVSFKDRFKLDLGVGYGFSYATSAIISGLYGLDNKYQTYLNKLDMEFSENWFQLRLTATYLFNPKIGIYLGIPTGVVEERKKGGMIERLFEDEQISAGVGDAYGGIFYNALSETNYRPNVIVNFDVNSNIAKFTSLGDGLWDFTPGIRVSKFVPGSKSVYLFGVSDYTFRLEENNVDPGGVIGYGGGMGYIFGGGAIESEIKAYRIGETEINSRKWFDEDNDLVFNFAYRSSFWKGMNWNFTVGNLDEGLDIKTNTIGFEASFPVF